MEFTKSCQVSKNLKAQWRSCRMTPNSVNQRYAFKFKKHYTQHTCPARRNYTQHARPAASRELQTSDITHTVARILADMSRSTSQHRTEAAVDSSIWTSTHKQLLLETKETNFYCLCWKEVEIESHKQFYLMISELGKISNGFSIRLEPRFTCLTESAFY